VSFPEKLVGVCPVCGGTGDDYGEVLDPSSTADAVGRGYDLVEYQGQVMCKMCKKWLKQQEESRLMTDWWNKEEVFRRKVGFVDEIT